MLEEPKILQSPTTTLRSESNSSFFTPRRNHSSKRFARSTSGSRSKSKEDQKEQISPHFYVKNAYQNMPNKFSPRDEADNRFSRTHDRSMKREGTPVKSKKQTQVQSTGPNVQEGNMEQQLEWLKLQRRCQLAESQNLKLLRINKALQQKLNECERLLSEAICQNQFYREKVKCFEAKDSNKVPKERNANLLKIKREIANQKNFEALPAQVTKQQFLSAHKEMQILRESLARSQRLRQQALAIAQFQKSEREAFLQDLVQQLKQELIEREDILAKLQIQLNIFLVRQARQEDRAQMQRNEQLQSIKKKYGMMLKRYHEVAHELVSYKRKNERFNHLFSNRGPRTQENSLSLSP